MSNFSTILLNADPNQVAYVYQSQIYTIKDIQSMTWGKVNALIKKQVTPGQRILLIANDSVDWITVFWALSIIGCCIIILHPKTSKDIIKNICNKHSIDAVITDNDLICDNSKCININQLISKTSCAVSPYNYSSHEAFVCFSTSGTSGFPKLTVHTNYSLLNWGNTMTSFYQRVSINKNKIILCLASMSFAVGFMTNIIGTMFTGVRSVVGVSPIEIRRLDQLCDEFSVAAILLTPYVLELILNSKNKLSSKNLEMIISGAEPLPDFLVEKFNKKFNLPIINTYGMSETCITFSEFNCHKSNSIGRPLNTIDIKIINDNGVSCKINEIGTLYKKTAGQTIGYLDNLTATSELLVNGWVNTNDQVSRDRDGDIIFHGRKNSCIKHKGQWISLLEIESIILKIEDVKNCVVLQTISELGISKIVAFISKIDCNTVIKKSDIQKILIRKFKKSHLTSDNIKFIEDIPLTVNAKKIRNYDVVVKKLL